MNKVTFATFDPLVHDAPILCDICTGNAPVFLYTLVADADEDVEAKGYCCGLCAPGFLRRLEYVEARQWDEEEAALEHADILDSVESTG
jgi:hypothetical protein